MDGFCRLQGFGRKKAKAERGFCPAKGRGKDSRAPARGCGAGLRSAEGKKPLQKRCFAMALPEQNRLRKSRMGFLNTLLSSVSPRWGGYWPMAFCAKAIMMRTPTEMNTTLAAIASGMVT